MQHHYARMMANNDLDELDDILFGSMEAESGEVCPYRPATTPRSDITCLNHPDVSAPSVVLACFEPFKARLQDHHYAQLDALVRPSAEPDSHYRACCQVATLEQRQANSHFERTGKHCPERTGQKTAGRQRRSAANRDHKDRCRLHLSASGERQQSESPAESARRGGTEPPAGSSAL